MRCETIDIFGIFIITQYIYIYKYLIALKEIQYAQAIINIPSYEFFPVLNLAQSVNIICYEIYKKQSILSETELQELNKLDDKESFYPTIILIFYRQNFLFHSTDYFIFCLSFFKDPNASRKDVIVLLKRLEDLLSKTNYMQKYNNNDSKV
jgi:tRNA C32,U32 (ribose-2'-O)-methylase TrmJ